MDYVLYDNINVWGVMIDGIREYSCSWEVKIYLGVEDGGGKEEEKEREKNKFCSVLFIFHMAQFFQWEVPKTF